MEPNLAGSIYVRFLCKASSFGKFSNIGVENFQYRLNYKTRGSAY
jgi:hypothetical protein